MCFFSFFLEKKNGITKEVEAELGSFDDRLLSKSKIKEKVINEKESVLEVKKINNSAPTTKNTSILQTCYDIITEFEDMTVRKNYNKDACSSSYLDSAINKIDKMYKSFDIVSKNSTREHSKNFKTYSVSNAFQKTKRIKPSDVEEKEKPYAESITLNTVDESLNENDASSNTNLSNHTVAADTHSEILNICTLYDDDNVFSKNECGEKYKSSLHSDQLKLYSETNDTLSHQFFENSLQRKKSDLNLPAVQIFKDSDTSKSENKLVFEKNVEEILARKSLEKNNENVEKSLKKKTKKVKKTEVCFTFLLD